MRETIAQFETNRLPVPLWLRHAEEKMLPLSLCRFAKQGSTSSTRTGKETLQQGIRPRHKASA
jgi:hypothetical protein